MSVCIRRRAIISQRRCTWHCAIEMRLYYFFIQLRILHDTSVLSRFHSISPDRYLNERKSKFLDITCSYSRSGIIKYGAGRSNAFGEDEDD